MNGEQFKALGVEQQVEYVNGLLEQGDTVDNIRAVLGVGKNYIGSNFSKGGYTKSRATGLYVLATGDTVNTCNTNNTSRTKRQSNNTSNNNVKALEKRVGSLEKELEQLKAMILSNTSNTNNIDSIINTNNTNVVMYSSENLVSRNYKIDRDVAEQFVKFCKVQKLTNDYKVSDLATNALVEYMNKFNK